MDENNLEKKHLTFFERVRAAVTTSLRRPQLPSVQRQPNIVPRSKTRAFTPSKSCLPTPTSAGKDESKKKTTGRYFGKSTQISESGSEEHVSTDYRSRPVTPNLHQGNRSEAAESDDYSSARSTASRQSLKPRSKASRKKLREDGGNKPTGSQIPIRENTTATSSLASHNLRTTKSSSKSEIPSASVHVFISKAYEYADLPLEISLSGVNVQKDLTHRATANIDQLPGSTHSPRSAATPRRPTKEVVKYTPPKCQTVARLNTVRTQARASPQQRTRPQTALSTAKSLRTNKHTQSATSESRSKFHKTSPDTASHHEQARPQTAQSALQSTSIDKPTQPATHPSPDTTPTHKGTQSHSPACLNTSPHEPADMLTNPAMVPQHQNSKTSTPSHGATLSHSPARLNTSRHEPADKLTNQAMVPQHQNSKPPRTTPNHGATQSNSSTHSNSANSKSRHEPADKLTNKAMVPQHQNSNASCTTPNHGVTQNNSSTPSNSTNSKSRHEPADKLKSHETSPQHQPSNNKANVNKNSPVITTLQKYGSGGPTSVVTSQTKLSNAIVAIDPGGHAKSNPLHKNDTLVRPRTSLASSNSRPKLLSESKQNQACSLTVMKSSVRPETTVEKVRLPNGPSNSRDTNTNKSSSTNNLITDVNNVDKPLRTDDKMEVLYSKATSSSSCLLNESHHTSSELFQIYQLPDSSSASWHTAINEVVDHPSSPTIRQTMSFPCTKAENALALETSSIIPMPLIRANTFLILKSGQGSTQRPLRREDTFLIEPSQKYNTQPKKKINMAISSVPHFTAKETTCKKVAGSGSELWRKTSSEIPLLKGSTYLILPAGATSRDTLDGTITIPLRKKSTYIVLSPTKRSSDISTTSSKMTMKRSGTYEVITSNKTNSMPNININDM